MTGLYLVQAVAKIDPQRKFPHHYRVAILLVTLTYFLIYWFIAAARSASQRLRGEVDNLITQCANEMWSHWNNTNMSFQQRITESNDAHNKLQSHLSKTMQEIYDQEKHIEALKKAIRDKGPPLKVLDGGYTLPFMFARSHRLAWRRAPIVPMWSSAGTPRTTALSRRSAPPLASSPCKVSIDSRGSF